jgi:hypothetical protein
MLKREMEQLNFELDRDGRIGFGNGIKVDHFLAAGIEF